MLELLAELDEAYADHAAMMARLLDRVPADVQSEIRRSIDVVRKRRIEISSPRKRILHSNAFACHARTRVRRSPRFKWAEADFQSSCSLFKSSAIEFDANHNATRFDTHMKKARENAAELRQIRKKASKARESFGSSPTE